MCLVNDNKEFDTTKQFIYVKVGVEAIAGVTVEGVHAEDGEDLHLDDGEVVDISCFADQGYPSAEIEWASPISENITDSLLVAKVSEPLEKSFRQIRKI